MGRTSVSRSGVSGTPWPMRRIVLVGAAVVLSLAASAMLLYSSVADPARGDAAAEREAQKELLRHVPEPAVLPKGKSKDSTYAPG